MKPRSRQYPLTREAAEALSEQIAGEGFSVKGVDRVWNYDAWCVQVVSRSRHLLLVHSLDEWEAHTRALAAPATV